MFYPALYTSLLFAAAGFLFQIYRFNKIGKSQQKEQWLKFKFSTALFNTLFQTKLFKASKTRWIIHFFVFSGFIYLLIFHAMDDLTSVKLFQYYQPTVDPYQFLRNLAGFMVAIGCLGFLLKQFLNNRRASALVDCHTANHEKVKVVNLPSHIKGSTRNIREKYQNLSAILLIFSIIFSGFLLEATKIISEPLFMEMVEDYAGIDEESGLEELKVYWEKNYSVMFQNTLASTKEALQEGKILNEEYCLDCHSNISTAFVSKALAGYIKETAQFFNDSQTAALMLSTKDGKSKSDNLLFQNFRADTLLYHIHYLLAFLMLISIPFSRLFHTLLIPFASLKPKSDITNFQNSDVRFSPVTLDACTGCMLCSQVCSVYPNFVITGNLTVLPHAKIEASRKIMLGQHLGREEIYNLQISNTECTMCNNCTDICPSDIDLQALWMTLSKSLNAIELTPAATPVLEKSQSKKKYDIISSTQSFDNCVQCTICTNVCPIVEYSSKDENDRTPQQIMNLLRLGKKQMAAQTSMVQNCLTCYSCQENCPGAIQVTDIMIELKQADAQC